MLTHLLSVLSRPALCAVSMLSLLLTPVPAFALDVRQQGYLERGTMQTTERGYEFVPDAPSGRFGGRYFRLSGSDDYVFYGLGGHPSIDWLWPTHKVNRSTWEIISASSGGLNFLERYQDTAEYTQGFARAGWIVMIGGFAALMGGLVYNLVPGNTREMQPIWFGVTGGIGAAGLVIWGGASSGAITNEALLDTSIDAYNREMAGRRRRAPLFVPPAIAP